MHRFANPNRFLRLAAAIVPCSAALAVLLLAPSTGLFVALSTEAVRSDPRIGWILGPLGYLAGCALGIQAVVRLGFGG